MTAKMFEFFSAKSIARWLLAIDVPMVRMRVTPASVRASQHVVEVRREIGVIEVGVGFDQHVFKKGPLPKRHSSLSFRAESRNLSLFHGRGESNPQTRDTAVDMTRK